MKGSLGDISVGHDHPAQIELVAELVALNSGELALSQVVELVASGVGLTHLERIEHASTGIGAIDGG